jgi:hypothetical protein
MKMYKSFGQFLFEASETAEERKKKKDMQDKLVKAKQAEAEAKKNLNKVEGDKDAEAKDVAKAKLIAAKTDAAVTQIDADIKLKAMDDKPEKKK